MNIMKRAFWILALVLISESSFAVAFSFRVQCAKNGNPELLEVYNKIPQRQSYILPTGNTMYFSGSYFNEYETAKERLDEVHELGIANAFIRVFKNRSFLSREVSDVLLKGILAERESIQLLKKTKKKTTEKPKIRTMSRVELMAYRSKKEKKKLKNSRIEYKDIKAPVIKKVSSRSEKSKKLKLKAFKKASRVKVTEAPVFKILIGESKGNEELPSQIDEMEELVYENSIGNNNYFTVGFYSSKKEGEDALQVYKRNPSNQRFKVIGFYKGSVISSELAQDLNSQFESQKKDK